MADVFGEAVQIVSADDAELRATLKKDEALVRDSSAKMQGSLDKLKVSAKGATGPVVNLSGAAAGLGVAGAASGNAIFGLAGQLTGLVAALGPVGLAIVGVSAAVFGLIKLVKSWNEETVEATERNKELAVVLKEKQAKIKATVQALQNETAIIRGEKKATDDLVPAIRAATLERDKALRQQAAKKAAKLEDIRLQKELTLADKQQREEKKRLADQERISLAATRKARVEAERARVGGLGPSSLSQATFQINRERQDEVTRRAGQKNLLDALRLQLATSKITLAEAARLSQRLGIDLGGGTEQGPNGTARSGSIALSAFASSGRGGGSVVFASSIPPGDKKQISQNDAMIKELKEIRANTKLGQNRTGELVLVS